MRFKSPVLRIALDEGVPNSVGFAFKDAGHKVIFLNNTITRGTSDILVCAFAALNEAILVAIDGDMRQIARGYGVSNGQYKNLNLIKLSCAETVAASRVKLFMTLIEHEWHVAGGTTGRRLFVDIGDTVVRTYR